MGLPHSVKTNGDHLLKDNLGRAVRRPLKWQRERKKGGAAGS